MEEEEKREKSEKGEEGERGGGGEEWGGDCLSLHWWMRSKASALESLPL